MLPDSIQFINSCPCFKQQVCQMHLVIERNIPCRRNKQGGRPPGKKTYDKCLRIRIPEHYFNAVCPFKSGCIRQRMRCFDLAYLLQRPCMSVFYYNDAVINPLSEYIFDCLSHRRRCLTCTDNNQFSEVAGLIAYYFIDNYFIIMEPYRFADRIV